MPDIRAISADLLSALAGTKALSQDLYSDALADFESELKLSLDNDADDALLCMLTAGGDVAMLLIDWGASVHRNDDALLKLRAMWKSSFDANAKILVPVLSEHISRNSLGVAGIKWTKSTTDSPK